MQPANYRCRTTHPPGGSGTGGGECVTLIQGTLMKQEKEERRERMKEAAILGGAFNPVTRGHLQAALHVLEKADIFDEVWLMPAYRHVYHKKMVSAEDRLAMCRIAASRDDRVDVCDYEMRREFVGGTYYLIKDLLCEPFIKDRYSLSLIIGQDNANTFHQWVCHEALRNLVRFVVVPRKGVPPQPGVDWYKKEPHIFLEGENPVMEVSSTEVRSLIAEGHYDEAAKLVDPGVLAYIMEKGLYGQSGGRSNHGEDSG